MELLLRVKQNWDRKYIYINVKEELTHFIATQEADYYRALSEINENKMPGM